MATWAVGKFGEDTSHSALAVVEGGAELFVGDSEGVLVHFWEGVVGRAHVVGEIGADELWGGRGIAGFGGGSLGWRGGVALGGKERIHWVGEMYWKERCKFIIQFFTSFELIPLAVGSVLWWATQRPTAQTSPTTGNHWLFPNRGIGAISPYPPYIQFPASRR